MNYHKKILLACFLFSPILLFNIASAEDFQGLYIANNKVYYDCPGGQITTPDELNVDIGSVEIINNRFFKDKNNVYHISVDSHSQICLFGVVEDSDPASFEFLNNYYQKDSTNVYKSDNYWGWSTPQIINDADPDTFRVLSDRYAIDEYRLYFSFDTNLKITDGVDPETIRVFTEDELYAMDKNSMFFEGDVLDNQGDKISNYLLYNNLKGKIVLRVGANGEAYYVHPAKQEMFFLSRPIIAFQVMRQQGVGITNANLEKIPVGLSNLSGSDVDQDGLPDLFEDSLGTSKNYEDSDGDGYSDKAELEGGYDPKIAGGAKMPYDLKFANLQKGKIFLQVERNGEAWYINPVDSKRYYLGRPTDAFNIMRTLGLGISEENFEKLTK